MEQLQRSIIELKNINKSYHSEPILTDFNLVIAENKFVTILGPSGSGKTTILKLIAGFESADSGEILLSGTEVNSLPPNKRNVNTVFQNYSLFPHMNVWENIAFGLKMKKKPKSYIDEAVSGALKLIKMEKFAFRKPDQLSGGQQQRVAVARAIVNKPLILLLDEPLSALDEKLRKQMQVELKQMQKKLGITFILVTHDQEEALSISDEIIVINNGKIEQIGMPEEIYSTPVNSFVAGFVGELNRFDAEVLELADDMLVLKLENQIICKIKNDDRFANKTKFTMMIRPENLKLQPLADSTEKNDKICGKIGEVRYRGALVDYFVLLPNKKRLIATVFHNKEHENDLHYKIGAEVEVTWLAGCEVLSQ